jgi:hypothetical protein
MYIYIHIYIQTYIYRWNCRIFNYYSSFQRFAILYHSWSMCLDESQICWCWTCCSRYMYVYVCIYACIGQSKPASIYIYTYIISYMYIYVCMDRVLGRIIDLLVLDVFKVYIYVYVCVYVCMGRSNPASINIYIYICTYKISFICMYIYIYICIYICMDRLFG